MEKIIVTGTSSGIGRCIATNLLQAGVNVVGLDKKESQIDDPSYVHISQIYIQAL